MAERLQYIIDIIKSGAEKDLKSLGNTADKELGRGGKAFQTLKANAGSFAIGAGAAIATFGVKAAQQFTTLALDVEKFSKATGASTDASSRWIEVAGDLGITTDQIQGGFVKLEKAIASGSPAVESLGISMQTAADGTADVSGTMLQAIKALDGVKDPAMKAKAASELFGKGFADMAELVTGDADAITEALSKVSSAKIIDQEEIAKAKKNRETIDELKDTFEDLTLQLGESFLPIMEATADSLTAVGEIAGAIKLDKVLGAVADLDESSYKLGVTIRDVFDPDASENFAMVEAFEASEQAAKDFDRGLLDGLTTYAAVNAKVLEVTGSQHAANLVANEWSKSTEDLTEAQKELSTATSMAGEAARGAEDMLAGKAEADRVAADAADEHREAQEKLMDAINGDLSTVFDYEQATYDLATSNQDLAEKIAEVEAAHTDGTLAGDDYEQALRDIRGAEISTAEQALKTAQAYAESKGAVEGSTEAAALQKGELKRLQDQFPQLRNEIQAYIDILGRIPTERTTVIRTSFSGSSPRSDSADEKGQYGGGRASGGPVFQGVMHPVGEGGKPELYEQNGVQYLIPGDNGTVTPASAGGSRSAGGSTVNITVNAGVNADGPEIARIIANKLREYQRFNGPGR